MVKTCYHQEKNKSCFVTGYPWVSKIGITRWVLFRLLTNVPGVFGLPFQIEETNLPCRQTLPLETRGVVDVGHSTANIGFPPTNQCFASAKCIRPFDIMWYIDKCWQCHLGITLAHLISDFQVRLQQVLATVTLVSFQPSTQMLAACVSGTANMVSVFSSQELWNCGLNLQSCAGRSIEVLCQDGQVTSFVARRSGYGVFCFCFQHG